MRVAGIAAMVGFLLRVERARQDLRARAFGAVRCHPQAFFGVALAVLLLNVVPPVGMIPLATTASFLAVLTLGLMGVLFLATVVLAPLSLVLF